MSQPALSMRSRSSRTSSRLSLVERRKSGVELTAGEEIVRRARTILASVRDLVDYASVRRRVIGCAEARGDPSITPYLLPAALPELQRRFPALDQCVKRSP